MEFGGRRIVRIRLCNKGCEGVMMDVIHAVATVNVKDELEIYSH